MKKLNCWEFKKCGREPGGDSVNDLGVCPAASETRLNGIHNGKNAGRACWVIAGTMCRGKIFGTFAEQYENCIACNFFKKVRKEEGVNYHFPLLILKKTRYAAFHR
jgi:hypothetical protein